jgi:DnaK suppressor protein
MNRSSMTKPHAPLTESDLVRMPAKAYMNRDQQAFFRSRLLSMRAELIERARATGEHLRQVEIGADVSDRATLEEEHALELRTRDRERKLLRKVDEALARIDEGTYGYCDETGEPIGLNRLLARATATLSLESQERREQRERQYGG